MSILNANTPKIWTFDHFLGVDVYTVNNLSALATPKKRSNDEGTEKDAKFGIFPLKRLK